jgi:hypothetical protein
MSESTENLTRSCRNRWHLECTDPWECECGCHREGFCKGCAKDIRNGECE